MTNSQANWLLVSSGMTFRDAISELEFDACWLYTVIASPKTSVVTHGYNWFFFLQEWLILQLCTSYADFFQRYVSIPHKRHYLKATWFPIPNTQ